VDGVGGRSRRTGSAGGGGAMRRQQGPVTRAVTGAAPVRGQPVRTLERLAARLHGADLATHLDLSARHLGLGHIIACSDRLPESYRAGLVSHLTDQRSDRLGAHPNRSLQEPGEVANGRTLRTLIERIEQLPPSARDPGRDTRDRILRRDLLLLLDLVLRGGGEPETLAHGLTLLETDPDWFAPRTLYILAERTEPHVQHLLARIIASTENHYQTFNGSSPYPARLHHRVHERYRELLGGLHRPARHDHHAATGSRTWHERAGGPATHGRHWQSGHMARLIDLLRRSEADPAFAQHWRALLSSVVAADTQRVETAGAAGGAEHDIDALLDVTETGRATGGVSVTLVCADLETLLQHDRIDPDMAAPVWAEIAARRGTAQHVPLAQMNRRSRNLVWDACWSRWLSRNTGSRWPGWCPWPSTRTLEQADATLLHENFPHPDAAPWLRQRIVVRLQRTSWNVRTTEQETADDLYCQAIRLSATWEGSLAHLLDTCVAATR
jgi:hypothetical protein